MTTTIDRADAAQHTRTTGASRRAWYRQLYTWVIAGIVAGIAVGYLAPQVGQSLEPLGTVFIGLIKMVIAPVIFCTVVAGIASMENLRTVGRVGVKALAYFEVLTTVALALGLVAVNVLRPGAGVNADAGSLTVDETVAGYAAAAADQPWYQTILHLFPTSVVGAFADNEVLQVLFIAVIFAFAVHAMGERGRPITAGVERVGQAFFGVIRIVMYAAPIGAFGAMAYTVGAYGIGTLTGLGKLIGLFYGTSAVFVLVVLGAVGGLVGVNVLRLIRYLKDELLIVIGTSSSESVLPQVMRKLENLGAARPVVGLTVPTGYSFNLDGTCIYLTLAALYIAQATNTPLSLGGQLAILGVLLLTSKGAAGVTGSGFVVLAATLSTVGTIPVAGIMLVFGVDKFMSECRALVNVIGNSMATLVVARWEGQLDTARMRAVLAGAHPTRPAPDPLPTHGDTGPAGALATTALEA